MRIYQMKGHFKIFPKFVFYHSCRFQKRRIILKRPVLRYPGSTLHGYLSKILARSCQDCGKILAKIVTRYCQELQDAMVRSYQESHVSKKTFIVKSYWERKNLKGSQQKSTLCRFILLDIKTSVSNV